MLRYKLRTLLIVLAIGPALLAGCYAAWNDPRLFWPVMVAAGYVAVFCAVVWLSIFCMLLYLARHDDSSVK
jgi:hypothetical protein